MVKTQANSKNQQKKAHASSVKNMNASRVLEKGQFVSL